MGGIRTEAGRGLAGRGYHTAPCPGWRPTHLGLGGAPTAPSPEQARGAGQKGAGWGQGKGAQPLLPSLALGGKWQRHRDGEWGTSAPVRQWERAENAAECWGPQWGLGRGPDLQPVPLLRARSPG